jgi:hypothetical protein
LNAAWQTLHTPLGLSFLLGCMAHLRPSIVRLRQARPVLDLPQCTS